MRRIAIVSILILAALVLAACSSLERERGFRGDFPRDRDFRFNRSMNITDEQRQAMMEERQQLVLEACNEKSEGDTCQIESPMGEREGNCNTIDNNLTCVINMPNRRPR